MSTLFVREALAIGLGRGRANDEAPVLLNTMSVWVTVTLLKKMTLSKTLLIAGVRFPSTEEPSESVARRVLPLGTVRVDNKGRVKVELAEFDLFKVRVLPEMVTLVTIVGIVLFTYVERSTVLTEVSASLRLKLLPDINASVTAGPKGTGIELPMCVVKVRMLSARATLFSHWVLLKALRIAGARSTELTKPSDSVAVRVLSLDTETVDREGGDGRVKLELAELDLVKIRVLSETVTLVTATGIALFTYGERLTLFEELSFKKRYNKLPIIITFCTRGPKGTDTKLPMCVVKVRVLLARATLSSHWVLLRALTTAGVRSADLTKPFDKVALRVLLPDTERADREGGEGRVTLELEELDFLKVSVFAERVTSTNAMGL
jgi:hypothetical protein